MENRYKLGDFMSFQLYENPSYGVITNTDKEKINITHFEDGFPFQIERNSDSDSIRKASKDESLEHFKNISKNINQKIESENGLVRAVLARKQHYLDGAISKIEEIGKDNNGFYAVKISPEDPRTGFYVLMGIYAGQGPSEHFESLHCKPRLSESTISQVMTELYPDGFGKIPHEVENTHATSQGDLVTYWTYEVPNDAIKFLKEVNTLKLDLK